MRSMINRNGCKIFKSEKTRVKKSKQELYLENVEKSMCQNSCINVIN